MVSDSPRWWIWFGCSTWDVQSREAAGTENTLRFGTGIIVSHAKKTHAQQRLCQPGKEVVEGNCAKLVESCMAVFAWSSVERGGGLAALRLRGFGETRTHCTSPNDHALASRARLLEFLNN